VSASFTIWYDRRDKTKVDPLVSLHVNLWVYNKDTDDSIDIGLMIKNPRSISKLYIYIPFICKKSNIQNLVKVLSDDKPTADLVFNGDISLRKRSGEIQKVTRSGVGKFEFYFLEGVIIDTLDGNKLDEGRILEYTFDDSLSGDDIYLRFRIEKIKNKGLVERYHKSVSYLTGAYNTLTSMEINFHEFRKLPSNIYQKAQHHHIKISSVNMFVMTDIHMEYIFSNVKNVKSRILESDKWIKYNPKLKKRKERRILAYQFKKESTESMKHLDDFSIFIKFNDEGAKKRNVVLALFLAFILGLGGSLTASYVEKSDFNLSSTVDMRSDQLFGDKEKKESDKK
jgi:hypothetical protein